jgi:hypothetical protein
VSRELKFMKAFGGAGKTDGKLNGPVACALSADECFVSDTGVCACYLC